MCRAVDLTLLHEARSVEVPPYASTNRENTNGFRNRRCHAR